MCQPWNLELHPEQFPRTIRLQEVGGRFFWAEADVGENPSLTFEGKWISDREFETNGGEIFVCPAPEGDGMRRGEVVRKDR